MTRLSTTLMTLIALTAACDSDSDVAEPAMDTAQLCADAHEHLEICLGEEVPVDDNCDVAQAEETLALSCEQLNAPQGARFLSGWLCTAGFLYNCPHPTCEPSAATLDDLADVESCSDYIGLPGCASCEYYACRDAQRPEPCGEDGYYLGFVQRYCELFTEVTRPNLSSQAQTWIDEVRTCLQLSMEDVGDDVACPEVRRIGYDRHPGCYTSTGFCDLPLADMLKILNTVDPRDLGIQPIQTGVACIQDWFDPASGMLTDETVNMLMAAGVNASES